jgi:hypothetical protein
MQAIALPFTGSGQIEPGQSGDVVGIAYTGFTQVVIHNGVDATGPVIANCGGPGTYSWNYEVLCDLGVFIQVTGVGAGTIWFAG